MVRDPIAGRGMPVHQCVVKVRVGRDRAAESLHLIKKGTPRRSKA